MHILILGAGAIGSLLGARLSRTQARVSLLTTDREHIKAIADKGLLLEELDGSISVLQIPGYDRPGDVPGLMDLVIVAVKSYDTPPALSSIRACCHASTLFLTLQNGIGNWELISSVVGTEPVLVGVTAQGATLVGPGRIRHGGNGPTTLGEFRGPPSQRVESLLELFREAGFQVASSGQMEQLVWEKLMINVGINAITALTGIRNGAVARLDTARDLCVTAVREAMAVAKAKGFPMPEEMPQRVISVAGATAVNRSSMGQDVDRHAQTEIDVINGAIVRFGEEAGLLTPVNRTLTQLIRIKETNYLEASQ